MDCDETATEPLTARAPPPDAAVAPEAKEEENEDVAAAAAAPEPEEQDEDSEDAASEYEDEDAPAAATEPGDAAAAPRKEGLTIRSRVRGLNAEEVQQNVVSPFDGPEPVTPYDDVDKGPGEWKTSKRPFLTSKPPSKAKPPKAKPPPKATAKVPAPAPTYTPSEDGSEDSDDPLLPIRPFPRVAAQYCPNDGTMLKTHVENKGTPAAQLEFFCPVCTYVHRPSRKLKVEVPTLKKAVEDIIGADDDDAQDRTSVRCPACGHGEAFFRQLQIRSADEPMTIFYRCCDKACSRQWNE